LVAPRYVWLEFLQAISLNIVAPTAIEQVASLAVFSFFANSLTSSLIQNA